MQSTQLIMKWADGSRTTNIPITKVSLGKLESIRQILRDMPEDEKIHGYSVSRWQSALNAEIKGRTDKCLGFLIAHEVNYPQDKFVENILVRARIFNNQQFAKARIIIKEAQSKSAEIVKERVTHFTPQSKRNTIGNIITA